MRYLTPFFCGYGWSGCPGPGFFGLAEKPWSRFVRVALGNPGPGFFGVTEETRVPASSGRREKTPYSGLFGLTKKPGSRFLRVGCITRVPDLFGLAAKTGSQIYSGSRQKPGPGLFGFSSALRLKTPPGGTRYSAV